MRNLLIVACIAMAAGAIAQSAAPSGASSEESRGLLSRLRNSGPSTRQQIQNPSREVAQPASAPQGYRPGVTYPQQQQQAQQPQQPAQQYPGYPPYNMQANPYYPPQQAAPAPGRPTPTPTPASGRRSSSDDDDDNRGSRSSSSSSRSGSSSSRSSSSDSNERKSSSSSSDSESKKPTSSSSSRNSDSEKKSSDSSSDSSSKSSALEKIAKKVESGKAGEKAEDEDSKKPTKSKEELEIEKEREAKLQNLDKATSVVAEFIQHAYDGSYSKAHDQLAPTVQKYFESEMSAASGSQKAVLDALTGNGTVNMVTYVNRAVRGEGAEVEAELGYEDGRTIRHTFDLIKVDDEWKIVLPVTPGATASRPSAATAAAAPTPAPQAVAPPPSAEQAAANAPLVLAPGPVSMDASTTDTQ